MQQFKNHHDNVYQLICDLKGEEEGALYLDQFVQNGIDEQLSEKLIRELQEEERKEFLKNKQHEADAMDETLALIQKMQLEEEEL